MELLSLINLDINRGNGTQELSSTRNVTYNSLYKVWY